MSDELKEELKEEVVSIKEITEVLDAIELLGVTISKASKDGFTTADFIHLVDLLQNVNVFVDAVKDIGECVTEAKDIDQAELLTIGTKAYTLVKNILDAKK